MKSSIFCFATALLFASGSSFAQDTAGDLREILALSIVNMHYTTADELASFCSQLDPAYSPRFAVKRVEWDKDIKRMYVMNSAMFKIMGSTKKSSAGTASADGLITSAEKMIEMSKQSAKKSNPDYEIPAEWKELKLGKNIKEDVQISMSGVDETEQKRRCEYVLTKRGMPAIPPKELP